MGILGCVDEKACTITNDNFVCIATIDEKIEDFNKTFLEEAEKCKNEFEKEIKSRHEKLEEYQKSKEGITEERLKELNKKEIEKEIDILSNEINKMHYIFYLGLESVQPIKAIMLKKLKKKAAKVPSNVLKILNEKINEINNLGDLEFLYSAYGKVLLDVLTRKGLNETLLFRLKQEIMKNRDERRKNERLEFGIKVNEFENENIEQFKLDLMELIKNENNEQHKNFKEFVKDKIIEKMYESLKPN